MLFPHAAVFVLYEPKNKGRVSLRDLVPSYGCPVWHPSHTCCFLHLFRYPGQKLSASGYRNLCDQCSGGIYHRLPAVSVLPVTRPHNRACRGSFCHATLFPDLHLFSTGSGSLHCTRLRSFLAIDFFYLRPVCQKGIHNIKFLRSQSPGFL